ncbi:MAG: hypothetical protein ACXVSE_13355 [Solirubrobacteraceae bacterium]
MTTPTLKFLADVEPLPDELAALDELVAPPPPAAALELEELLLPHAVASARAAATTTIGVPRRQILDLITAPLSASAKARAYTTSGIDVEALRPRPRSITSG